MRPAFSRLDNIWRVVEGLLGFLGTLNVLTIVLIFSANQRSIPSPGVNPIWPLPGLYFLEICLVSLTALVDLIFLKPGQVVDTLSWLAAGILLAFVFIGGFSIGPFLIPAIAAFVIAGIIRDMRGHHKMASHLGIFLLSGLLQVFLVILVISYSIP